MTRPVVAAVCYRPGNGEYEFLLVRTKGGKYWTFPKGHVEATERPWEAAAREAKEEAGASGHIQQRAFVSYVYFKDEPPDNVDAYLMAVTSESASHEAGRRPQWFTADVAVRKLAEGRNEEALREHERVIQAALRTLHSNG